MKEIEALTEFLKAWGIDPNEKKVEELVLKRIAENPKFFEEAIPLIESTKEHLDKISKEIKKEVEESK